MKRHISSLLLVLLFFMCNSSDVDAQLQPLALSFFFGEGACDSPGLPVFPEGVTVSPFISTNIGCHAGEGHVSRLWPTSDTINPNQYVGFTLAAEENELLSFNETDSLYISALSGNGIRIQPVYLINGVSYILGDTVLAGDFPPLSYAFSMGESFSADSLEIRIYGYNSNSSSGLLFITELSLTFQATNIRVSTEEERPVPELLHAHVYPNPVTTMASISFDAPVSGNAQLVIYDLLGRKIDTLFDNWLHAGPHRITRYMGHYGSGIYVYHLRTGKRLASGKIVIVQ